MEKYIVIWNEAKSDLKNLISDIELLINLNNREIEKQQNEYIEGRVNAIKFAVIHC